MFLDEGIKTNFRPSYKAIIKYLEGGYFGDSDIFAKFCNITSEKTGRDARAVGNQDCSIFVMQIKEVNKIRDLFNDVYLEMKQIGIQRYKNHKI